MRSTSQYIASLPEAEHSLSPSQLKQGVAQVLYQNVDAIRALLYESAPILDSWAKAQVKAQQLTNPKGAGRKPANPVLMFLILLVRSFLGLSNTKLARVLVSDLSVQQFVSEQLDWLAAQQRMERLEQLHFPKLSTIRKYIELFAHDGILAECNAKATKFFVTYGAAFLEPPQKDEEHYKPEQVGLIDASFITVPVTHLPKHLYAAVKAGHVEEIESLWPRSVSCQKNLDARWAKKRNERFFGFKLHTLTDFTTKMILADIFTPANEHDVTKLIALSQLAPEPMFKLYADSGYCGDSYEEALSQQGFKAVFIKRAYGKHSLTIEDVAENNKRSHMRVRVEHAYAAMKHNLSFKPTSKSTTCIQGECDLAVMAYNARRYQAIKDGRTVVPKTYKGETNKAVLVSGQLEVAKAAKAGHFPLTPPSPICSV